MKRQLTWMVGGLLLAAPTLGAQNNVAAELGVFVQYSKYDAFTHLKDGYGAGARLGIYPFKNFALEYEADMTKTSSSLLGDLTAWNNRIDGIFYFPMSPKLKLLVGGGWTGTRYYSDTTLNEFDSGGNAVVGFKYCFSDKWAMRTDVNADFKDPSDQTLSGERTRTYNVRLGFSRFLGGPSRNSPCYIAPPPPPPAPVYVAPVPAPAPPPPPPMPPTPVAQETPQQAAPAPPVRRSLMTLRGNNFEFDSSSLTAGAKDTLQVAVNTLKTYPDIKIEIQGHTDWIGTDAYNQALSERRANSVRDFFISQGIAAGRITTIGFGETQPVATNDTAAGRAENRRVVIIEVP
ncbi:MAG: OmpA family protein [Gemmatimonadaceae bacterium]|jgi:outer membrane protein OmpA-like peptidoglycan-associated protein